MDEASEMVPASKWCLFGRTWSASLKTLFAFFLVKSSSLVLSYSFHSPLFYLMLGDSLTVPVPYTGCWEEHSSAGEDVSRIILAATQALQKPGRRFPGPKQDALAGPSCQFCSHNSRGKRKKIAFGFFCERILGICRKCPGGESVLSSVLFPADGCHYMRYAMQRYLIAASVPHAGTLLTAFLDTVLGSACCFSQSMANSCAGVKYIGPFGVTWGAAWENRL